MGGRSGLAGPAAVAAGPDEGPEELFELAGVIPGEGPPIILLAAPLVLFGLALAGPFLLLLTLAAVVVAGAVLLALAAAVVASPYLLVRRLRPRAHGEG